MTAPLDIIRTSGRAAKPLEIEFVRALEPADLPLLQLERGTTPSPIKRLRERHHALARNLASGMTESDAAAICGYDIARVSILKGDPTFRELIEFYREDVTKQYAQLHETLAGMSLDAALLLRERLEEKGEDIAIDKLIEVVKMGADRTGFGPSSKQEVNVNVNLASRLEEARKRVAQRTLELRANES